MLTKTVNGARCRAPDADAISFSVSGKKFPPILLPAAGGGAPPPPSFESQESAAKIRMISGRVPSAPEWRRFVRRSDPLSHAGRPGMRGSSRPGCCANASRARTLSWSRSRRRMPRAEPRVSIAALSSRRAIVALRLTRRRFALQSAMQADIGKSDACIFGCGTRSASAWIGTRRASMPASMATAT